jgi:hypothetical protein
MKHFLHKNGSVSNALKLFKCNGNNRNNKENKSANMPKV